jgi:hypothetical protein
MQAAQVSVAVALRSASCSAMSASR